MLTATHHAAAIKVVLGSTSCSSSLRPVSSYTFFILSILISRHARSSSRCRFPRARHALQRRGAPQARSDCRSWEGMRVLLLCEAHMLRVRLLQWYTLSWDGMQYLDSTNSVLMIQQHNRYVLHPL